MAAWGWSAVLYAGYLVGLGCVGRTRRRGRAVTASAAYGIAAAAAATLDNVTAQVVLPGACTLGGYWLSGLFAGTPQQWLEQWLLQSDRALFRRLSIDRLLAAAPLWSLEVLEFSYSTVYLVVVAGAVAMALIGREAILYFWAVVLPAELICYAALSFLRSRPPRSLEPTGVIASRAPIMRRVNDAIIGRGSIQVNTIPSGHVAGATAAGLAVMSWLPAEGAVLLVSAGLIAAAATVGRYHYAIDCVLGAGVALAVWWVA